MVGFQASGDLGRSEKREGKGVWAVGRACFVAHSYVWVGGQEASKQAGASQVPVCCVVKSKKGATLARRELSMMVQRAEVGLLLGL